MANQNPDFLEEKKKLFEETKDTNIKLARTSEDAESQENRIWNLNMSCYLMDNQKCLKQYEQFYLNLNRIKREKLAVSEACFEKCLEMLNPTSKLKNDIYDRKSLENYKEYQKCAKPCIQETLNYMSNEIQFTKENIQKLRDEFFPDKR